MVGMFDSNRDGTINFQEFTGLWNYIQDWKRTFNSFDRDGSGSIEPNELHMACQSFGYNVSPQFCNFCVSKFDRDGRRAMRFDDFIQFCVMLKNLTDSFRQYDTQKNGWARLNYYTFLELAINNTP
eukprot:Nk52_evm14s1178 gene=Nk52_evmTU14s1178